MYKRQEQLRLNARKLARKYNLTDEDNQEEQAQILRKLLPATEELPYLQAPVYFDYGCNTYFGKFSSANFNFTCLDVCEIHIGDNVMIGPNVTLATPMHPLLPEAVSYTHLDVYKRQILQCLLVIINHEITGNGIENLKRARDDLQAVSYTHLDVYKRQMLENHQELDIGRLSLYQ